MNELEKYKDKIYAVLRITTGLMFSVHGMQKILGVLTDWQPELFSQMWFGGIIELIGGLLITIGYQTRIAAFIASGTMAVAYFQFHWKFQLGAEILPIINKGEMAVLYCFLFLFIASKGAGVWALEKK